MVPDELMRFSHTTISWVYSEWSKNRIYPVRHIALLMPDVRLLKGQTGRDEKATVNLVTRRYNQGDATKNSGSSECNQ